MQSPFIFSKFILLIAFLLFISNRHQTDSEARAQVKLKEAEMNRKTRSGRTFAQWNGYRAVAASPWFDFALGVQAAINCESPDDYDPTLDLSPLPSLRSSPSPLPVASSAASALHESAPHRQTAQAPPSLPIPTPAMSDGICKAGGTQSQPKPNKKLPNNHAPLTEAQARRKRKKKMKGHENSRRRRAQENEAKFSHHTVRPSTQRKYIDGSIPMHTVMDTEDANVASTAYVGLNDFRTREDHSWALEDLVGEISKFNFKLVPWDGHTAMPLVSADGTLLGVLAGHCDANDWPRLHQEAVDAFEEARRDMRHPPRRGLPRRGDFSTLRCGVSYGSGQEYPCNLSNNKTNAAIAERLNGLEVFRRLAGFATSVMATWAPDLHKYYVKTLDLLHRHDPTLKRIFRGSVFASSTYNLGPRTVCYRHTDFANLPFGWCGITAFGSYDHTRGGHLVLWDCQLVIEFPPGSTILIPSAVVAHSNVPISEGETRYSFTQYTSGQMFQWVSNGFQTVTSFEASLSPKELLEHRLGHEKRWKFGLSLVPRFPVEDALETSE